MTHYMFHSSKFTTTAAQNHECYMMHLRNQNQHSQTDEHSSLCPFLTHSPLSTNNLNTKFHRASSAMTVPTFLSLSLSALQCLNCQANQTASNFSLKVTSANLRHAPLFLHTTEPQVFNYSRLISTLHSNPIQFFHEPRSLPNYSPTLQVPTFSFMNQGPCQKHSPTLQVPTFLFHLQA